jgi:hypothetical protein
MNRLLIRAKTMINPPPERIIWCYKRWQPLFSEMQSTIKKHTISARFSSKSE